MVTSSLGLKSVTFECYFLTSGDSTYEKFFSDFIASMHKYINMRQFDLVEKIIGLVSQIRFQILALLINKEVGK